MTDFRNLRPDHDLRSQLGLKPFDREAFSKDVCATLSVDQVCKMSVIGEALHFEPKPLNPKDATPDPLHRTITAMGCTDQTKALRTALAGNKLLSSSHTVTVNCRANDPVSKDASEIVASIRRMIDSPQVQHLRAIGKLSAAPRAIDVLNAAERFYGRPVDPYTLEPYTPQSIKLEETSMADMSSQLLFDARRLAAVFPAGVILIKGMEPADYVAQFIDPNGGVVQVKYEDIKSVSKLTVAQASVLRGLGLYAVGGYFLGVPVNKTEPGKPVPMSTNAPAPRTLTDILSHIKNLEEDILDALIMANENPNTDRRRAAAARDQLEMGFMMLKKAVDPEQGDQ